MRDRCPNCNCELDIRLRDDDTFEIREVPFVPIDVGDIVRSKSGIPMTVEGYDGINFDCVWFEQVDDKWTGPHRMRFARDDLERLTRRGDKS